MKTSSVNIVRASKMHVCVEYGHILANYDMDVAKTPVIWPETLKCSYEIARFFENIFNRTLVFQVYFFLDTREYIMTPREVLTPFWIFVNFVEFSMPVSGKSQDGGHDRS